MAGLNSDEDAMLNFYVFVGKLTNALAHNIAQGSILKLSQ